MVKLILIIAAGAGIGALLGRTRSCETGACPLTATPARGAMYGAFLAALAGFGLMRPGASSTKEAAATSDRIVAISSEAQFEAEVLDSAEPVLVDFYATWCGPCTRLAPVMVELAEDPDAPLKVVKVDVDANRELAGKYGVSSIPDVRVFAAGKETDRFIGIQDKKVYRQAVEKAAHPTAD